MPTVETNVEVYCTCGEGLCNQTESTGTRGRREPCFIVKPCTNCMENAKDDGHKEGYGEGIADGREENQ